jgi:flagellar basal body-associated protein FliL
MDNEFADIPPIEEAQGEKSNRTMIIIIVVVLLVLCCCCAAILAGAWFFGDAIIDAVENLTRLPGLISAV